MKKVKPSPRIQHISWGKMKVEGIGEGKDFKLWPGGGCEWDWRESNTHHNPGIQSIEIEELIRKGAEVLILSQGMLSMLRTSEAALNAAKKSNIQYFIEPTKNAVNRYNKLIEQGVAVGGLFHSTC